jgi:hypothetical protein
MASDDLGQTGGGAFEGVPVPGGPLEVICDQQVYIAELQTRIERLRAVARKADVVLHDMTEGERDGLYGEELEAALYSLQPGDLED